MEYHPPPLFVRGPAPFVRLVFFVVLSAFLMVLDARFKYMEPLRQGLLWVAYPIQRAATAPIDAFGRVREFFVTQATLQSENAQLRAERLKDSEDLLKLQALQQENATLRSLLAARERAGGRGTFAEIVYLGRDPFSRRVIIDKGSQEGIEAGRPVIDATGVVGQVTRVHPLVAEVTLVIDKEHAVPVVSLRNGLRGIAFGAGDGRSLELRFMPANADIEAGDTLVTSGLDGVYPAGLPVAKVQRVDRDASYQFARILLAPVGAPGSNKEVLVLSKPELVPAYPEDVQEPVKRPQRARRPNPTRLAP
jgi:rod shape-determining protein MreC